MAISVAVALLVGACGQGPVSLSEFELLPLEGTVEVLQGGEWKPVSEKTGVSRGDQVRAGPDGKARIHLPGEQTVELAPEARVRVAGPEAAEVLGGSVLAQARQGLAVALDGLEVTAADAVFRLDLELSRRLAVYRGEAAVPGSGWDEPVTAFQQLTLVGRSAPRGPVPLQVDTNDRWDVRLLGEAMDVGLALLQQETGLASQLRDQAARKTVFDTLSKALPGENLRSQLAKLPPAVVVVAATIAMTLEDALPAEVLDQILDLRALGASWIVVAGLLGVGRSVLATLEDIVSSIVVGVNPQAASPVPFISSGGVDVGTIGGFGGGGSGGGSGGGGSGGGGTGGGG
ncbi:MAG TPA: hypothetical protein VE915_06070, partial [Actinomycetota bacterium]|nr:hypothetical protein [Actinomycetota bacterium]